jgi:proteasome lid subunit RPN8/RPN11
MTDVPNVLPGVLDTIRGQTRSRSDAPVGGILIGWVEGDAMTVERAVPTPEAEEHSGELVFTPPCWDLAYSQLELVGPESRIVGWYHASPTHGLELSAYDRSLHRTLFPDPAHVALVVDPDSEGVAWFGWEVERIAALKAEPETATADGAAAVVAAAQAQGEKPRRRLAGGLLVLVLLGAVAVGAFLWGHSSSRTTVVTEVAPTSTPVTTSPSGPTQQQLDQAQAEAESLRAQLAQEQARLQAVRAALKRTKAELQAASNKPKPSGTFVFKYQVRPGDSMFTLAQTFYGTGAAWAKIWHANPSPDPNVIETGAWLKIPLQNPN